MSQTAKKSAASAALEAAFKAIQSISADPTDRPEFDPRLIILRQLEALIRTAYAHARMLEHEAAMASAETGRAHREVLKRIELMEMELGIEREDDDEHATCGGVGA